jgi:cytochrome c
MKKIISWSLFLLIIILFMHPDLVLAKSSVNRDIKGSDLLVPLPDQSTEMQDKDLGVGPAKHVELGPINAKMVGEGKTIYGNQCIICHDLDQNKLGPALKMVTKSRTPEYIMNMLLNPAQMQKENANVKALLKQYNNLPMPDPALNQEKARSVLEYLRSLAK